MLVAFASSDGKTVDSHFASAPSFEIYRFTEESQGIIHTSFAAGDLEESEDKVDARIKVLHKCAIIYCTEIGGPAAARLVQTGIHPLKVPEGTNIEDELLRLKNLLLSQKLPPWLKKKIAGTKD